MFVPFTKEKWYYKQIKVNLKEHLIQKANDFDPQLVFHIQKYLIAGKALYELLKTCTNKCIKDSFSLLIKCTIKFSHKLLLPFIPIQIDNTDEIVAKETEDSRLNGSLTTSTKLKKYVNSEPTIYLEDQVGKKCLFSASRGKSDHLVIYNVDLPS